MIARTLLRSVERDRRGHALGIRATREQLEPHPQILHGAEAALEHDRTERRRPYTLDDAEVAAALLDDLRLHRRFEARDLGERGTAELHLVADRCAGRI